MKIQSIMMLLISITFSAYAHVPFLKPNLFNIPYDRLVIESSFTEDPFHADFAMESPAFYIVDSSGVKTVILPAAKTIAAVYLEPKIINDGTYRINASLTKGPKYRAIETFQRKLYFAEDIKKKQGKMTELQYFSGADTYVTKGKSNYKPNLLGKGIEIIPMSSPNSLLVNQKATFRVYDNGKPVGNARVVVVYDDEYYQKKDTIDLYDIENERESNIFADNNVFFTFTPKKAGLVLLFVNVHKKIDDSLWESYNTSLTLETNL